MVTNPLVISFLLFSPYYNESMRLVKRIAVFLYKYIFLFEIYLLLFPAYKSDFHSPLFCRTLHLEWVLQGRSFWTAPRSTEKTQFPLGGRYLILETHSK